MAPAWSASRAAGTTRAGHSRTAPSGSRRSSASVQAHSAPDWRATRTNVTDPDATVG